ncbi:MAG: DUF6756 family protein [Janthinobacterium lividum]
MLQAKMRWENALSLRAEIEKIRHQLAIPEDQFRPLGLQEWPGIREKIYHIFCRLDDPIVRPIWLWEYFKLETYTWYQPGILPDFLLEKLVEEQETVWLMLNTTINEHTKFWLYQGHINAIKQLLSECYLTDEIYIVSKKYEWLLCINHHDILYATGGDMPAKLRQLKASMV